MLEILIFVHLFADAQVQAATTHLNARRLQAIDAWFRWMSQFSFRSIRVANSRSFASWLALYDQHATFNAAMRESAPADPSLGTFIGALT